MSNSQPTPYKIIFLGTPEFAAPILEALIAAAAKPAAAPGATAPQNNWQIAAVITAPDKPAGRGNQLTESPIKKLAQIHQIPVFQPIKISEIKEKITELKPDLFVTAAYGKILPPEILTIPSRGCINIHPSLLPKYRGPSPIQFVILNGEKETGATIMLMDEKMDEGPLLAQAKLTLADNETAFSLSQKLSRLSADLLIQTLPGWLNGQIQPRKQDHGQATYTKILTKEDGLINWQKPVLEIERQIRALNPWPGAFTFWSKNNQPQRLKILKAMVIACPPDEKTHPAGQVFSINKQIAVQAGDNTCLILNSVQPAAKKAMTGQEFLNGHPEIIDAVLSARP